jgi:hypothetical protein
MSTINFNDKIFVQEALQQFTLMLTPLNAFSRSFSGVTSQKGDTVAVPRVERLTATTFDYATNSGYPYEAGGGEINTISIPILQHKIVTVDITDIQAANSSAAQIDNFARQQGKALGRLVLETIFGAFTTVNYGAALTSLSIANLGRLAVSGGRKDMVNRGVPMDQSSLIVNPDFYQNLLDDGNISESFKYGGSEAIREARIPRLYGMDTYEAPILPLNGTVSLAGMIVHPDALGVAIRVLQPQDGGQSYLATETAIDDESGIAMGYRRHFNPGRGRHYASFECLFGFSVGLSLGGGLFRRAN